MTVNTLNGCSAFERTTGREPPAAFTRRGLPPLEHGYRQLPIRRRRADVQYSSAAAAGFREPWAWGGSQDTGRVRSGTAAWQSARLRRWPAYRQSVEHVRGSGRVDGHGKTDDRRRAPCSEASCGRPLDPACTRGREPPRPLPRSPFRMSRRPGIRGSRCSGPVVHGSRHGGILACGRRGRRARRLLRHYANTSGESFIKTLPREEIYANACEPRPHANEHLKLHRATLQLPATALGAWPPIS
jgi:hypothetical protein